MATSDTRKIVLTLKWEDKVGVSQEDENQTQTKGDDSSKKEKSTFKALTMQTVSQVANEIVAFAEYSWNKQLQLTDDYIGQRNKQIAMQAINFGISSVTSIAAATAMFGVAGFVASTAMIGVSSLRQNLQAQDQQNIMIRQMDAQLDFTRNRAGWSTSAASIGEDL